MKENHIKSSVWRGSVGRATLSGESGCRHLGVALPGTYTSQTFPSEHSPTNNRIDYKMDQNGRVCTSTHRVIACRRTTITPIGPSATLYYGDPGTAPCNWKLTQEKRIFPATTILMCFIINYHFAINSVYQGGGSNWKSQMSRQKGIPTKVWHKTKITLFFLTMDGPKHPKGHWPKHQKGQHYWKECLGARSAGRSCW